MSQFNSSNQPKDFQMKPPLLSAPIRVTPNRGLAPWAIVAICVGSVALLVGILVVAAVMFFRIHAVEGRQSRSSGSPITKATPANPSDGLSYYNDRVPREPWSIHVLKIDRSQKGLSFFSAHARNKVLGVSLLADQARAVPPEIGRALAGINGDFYVRDVPGFAGDPRGLQIVNGELISAPDTVCVWFDAEGNPHLDEVKGNFTVTWPEGRKSPFGLNQQRGSTLPVLYTPTYGSATGTRGGRDLILEQDGESPWLPLRAGEVFRARVRTVSTTGNTPLTPDIMVLSLAPQLQSSLPDVAPGAVLQISTATTPDLKGVKAAIAGGPALIRNGKAFTLKNPPSGAPGGYAEASKYQRHPRSAVGWSPTHIYLVTVDGRQPGLSVGMKLAELAEYFVKLGCTEAMNFDGGKSAQMWLNGQIVNSPAQGEDTVANSLLVVRKADVK